MQRYTALLTKAYEQLGADVRLLRPTGVLSRRIAAPGAAKLVMYVEELILFPLRVQLGGRSTDRYHVADHSDAPWAMVPRLWGRTAITCHDLTAVRAALGEFGMHRPGRSGRLQQRLIRAGLRRASTVLAVSQATEGDVRRVIPDVPTAVLLNPIDEALLDAADDRAISGEAEPYVVMVSNDAWYKRRPLALQMWHRLRLEEPRLRLVVVGSPFTDADIETAGLRAAWPALLPSIEFAAGVDDRRLAEIYRGAEALLQSSAYEGFCWPVAEANACGTLALCTDIPVLREVGPDNLFLPDTADLEPLAALWQQRNDPARLLAAETYSRRTYTWSSFVNTLGTLTA